MQKFPRRWDKKTCIDFLQRKILLNSIAYYELACSKMTDQEFDELSKQLVQMQSEYGDLSSTQYGYIFYDFDGTTGFHLMDRLNDKDKEYILMMVNWIFKINHEPDVKVAKKKKRGALF